MRSLQNKPNVDAPDSDYPFGKIRDRNGATNGTGVNENAYGDMHQFFEKMMNESGIVANDLPDNDYNDFQLFRALTSLCKYKTTSTSSVVIGTGSKTFTVNTYLAYTVGQSVRIQDNGNSANYMYGVVSSYSTNQLVVLVKATWGSGTIASWTINLAGFYIETPTALTAINSYDVNAQYAKDSLGNVILSGMVGSPGSVTNPAFAVLPAGYRPAVARNFAVGYWGASQDNVLCYVETSGECRLYVNNGSPTNVSASKNFDITPVRFNINMTM